MRRLNVGFSVGVLSSFLLSSVYPNLFKPSASFTLGMNRSQTVSLCMYNVLGQRVLTAYEGELAADQTHTFALDGSHLPSGVYMLRAVGEVFTATRAVMLMK